MRKKNLVIVKVLALILGIIMGLYIFGSEVKIVSSEDEIFYARGETDFPSQEGSCFWGGRLVNGMFYFYIYKEGSWQFSNDVRASGMCPIKIWPEPAQKTFSDVWSSGYIGAPEHKDKLIQEDFITREKSCRCYDDLLIDDGIKSIALETADLGEILGLEKEYLRGYGVEYYNISHYGDFYDIFNKPEKTEKGIVITFIEKDAFLNIGEDKFTNIELQKSPKHPPYIFLDENGEIIRADFTVNSNGGKYTFEGKTISVPPNSRVFFDERIIGSVHIPSGIDIQIPEGIDLTEFSSLFDIFGESESSLTVRGNDINFPNGLVLKNNDDDEGELIITKEGYFLTRGMVEHKGMRFDASKQTGDVLFTDSSIDSSGYNGNKVIINEENFEMHSSEDGAVIMRVLPGNELFNTFKHVQDDKGNLIEIPDENDYLQLEAYRGSWFEVFKEREDVIVKHYGNNTVIRNGKSTLELDSGYGNYEPYSKYKKDNPYSIVTSTSLLGSPEAVDFILRGAGTDYDLVFYKNSLSYVLPNGEGIISLTQASY